MTDAAADAEAAEAEAGMRLRELLAPFHRSALAGLLVQEGEGGGEEGSMRVLWDPLPLYVYRTRCACMCRSCMFACLPACGAVRCGVLEMGWGWGSAVYIRAGWSAKGRMPPIKPNRGHTNLSRPHPNRTKSISLPHLNQTTPNRHHHPSHHHT
jgi:acetyl-CoA acetyltransferase